MRNSCNNLSAKHWGLLHFCYKFFTLEKALLTEKIASDIIHLNQDR